MSTYKVIQLNSFKENPIVGSKIKRKPLSGEVLVKVERSTIHPSDLYFLKGMYGLHIPKVFPIVPGFEGSGIIEEVGDKVDKQLIGKYCSIGAIVTSPDKEFNGLWAQYYYTNPSNLLIYDKKVDLNTACFAYANPLSAYGFYHIAKLNNSKAVVQNGAFSTVGKIFLRLCIKYKLPLINLVRKEDQIAKLKEMGAEYVINVSNKGWENEFQILCEKLKCDLMFECVGGNTTSKIFSLLPNNSTLIHFGNLELKKLNGFDSSEFIFKNKCIKGFWLNTWLKSLDKDERKKVMLELVNEIEISSDLIKTDIFVETGIDDFLKHIDEYAKNMSQGKVLLKPNF